MERLGFVLVVDMRLGTIVAGVAEINEGLVRVTNSRMVGGDIPQVEELARTGPTEGVKYSPTVSRLYIPLTAVWKIFETEEFLWH